MRKIIFSIVFIILAISTISADIIITQQPKEIYSLGDILDIPVKITTLTDLKSLFTIDLICNGIETEIYKEYLALSTGEEISRNPKVPLMQSFIGKPRGECVLKASLGTESFELTNKFSISDYINIAISQQKAEAQPGEEIILEGTATKDNGQATQGFAELTIIRDNETVLQKPDTVKNGYFYFNFSLPKNSKAGQYLVKLDIYETDLDGIKTNKGFINYNLLISQIPTNLEIVFDTNEVEPGTNLKVKTVLHDQTGVPIETNSIITIKNQEGEIIDQIEEPTNTFLEFPIAYNEPAGKWKVIGVSNRVTGESEFNITEKEDINISLINRTITIANTGNIPYCNKSVLIKIGNESVNVDVCVGVDEEQEYLLTAPEGEYQVEVISEGEQKISQNILLTGRTIDVKEVSKRALAKHPIIWVFLIGILGFVAFLIFKKGFKRNFIGHISKRKKGKREKRSPEKFFLNTKNKAELSLSIKGDKQNASIICLKIKDLKETLSKKGVIEEAIQKIIKLIEEKKAYVYENNDNLFIILAPVITKTFANEKTAIELANEIQKILTGASRLAKDKIEFGIGLNYGTIVAKKEKNALKFMSMGTLITTAKKTATLSKGEIFLGEKINERLRTKVKTEKQTHGNFNIYKIKEIKEIKDHKNFLSNFVKRLEKEKKEKEEKEKSN